MDINIFHTIAHHPQEIGESDLVDNKRIQANLGNFCFFQSQCELLASVLMYVAEYFVGYLVVLLVVRSDSGKFRILKIMYHASQLHEIRNI